MAYKQLHDANWRIPYEGGWCLNFVQRAFNTPWSGSSAADAWYNRTAHKHTDIPPLGITVPIFFTGLGLIGGGYPEHVAIRLSDGTVASSTLAGKHNQGYIHPNIEHMLQAYRNYGYRNIRYAGWSEDLGGKRLVEPVSSAKPAHWRKTKIADVNFRTEPKLSAPAKINNYPAGSDIEMAGYVKGENYSGSDIWFKTKVSGLYAWSGTMTDSSTNGLSDLTPKPSPAPAPQTAPAPKPAEGKYLPDINRYTFLVDISRYQDFGDAEFIKLKEAGVDGIIISAGATGPSYGGTKVSVGEDVKSSSIMSNGEWEFGITPSHQKQVDLARKHGFAVGHYYYCYQSLDPVRQARVFASADIRKEGEPLFIDAEEKDLTQEWVNAFRAELLKLTGKGSIYYDYTSNLKSKDIEEGVVWLADYTHEPYKFGTFKRPHDVIIHQYTSSGRIPGIDANLDFNATPHSIDKFKEWGKIVKVEEVKVEQPKEQPKEEPKEEPKEVLVEVPTTAPAEDVSTFKIPAPAKEVITEMQKEIQSAALSAWKVDGTRKNAIRSASMMVGRLATQFMVSGVISQGLMTVIKQALPLLAAGLPAVTTEILTVIVLIVAVFASQYGYKLDKFKWPF